MADVATQIEDLRAAYPGAVVEPRPDGSFLIRLPEVPLPPGWSQPSVAITFVVPVGYPMARPDCFWADAGLRLGNGAGLPSNTAMNTTYGGSQPLLWFSYHASAWNPNQDTLLTYARVVRRRLSEVR
jgi:hypothetical protein